MFSGYVCRVISATSVANVYVPTIGECRKASKILVSFIDPSESFGPEKVIPPEILGHAKVGVCPPPP